MPINPYVKGSTDVSVTDGGTGASTAGGARTNLMALDETAHDLLDHTGLTGVGDLTTTTHAGIDHGSFTHSLLNVGTTTLAASSGDLASGLTGGIQFHYDQSLGRMRFYNGANVSTDILAGTLSGMLMTSAGAMNFSSSATDATATADVGIARRSAGIIRISDGSTGDATLEAGTVQIGNGGPTLTASGTTTLILTSGTTSYPLTAAGIGPALTTTAQTIIEAINEVDAAAVVSSLSDVLAVGNTTGANDVVISAGQTLRGVDAATGTDLNLRAGASSGAAIAGGSATISGGIPTDGAGGSVSLIAEDGVGTNRDGGNVGITAGAATGSGAQGRVLFTSGTTSYPLTAAGVGPALTTTAQDIIGAINEVGGAALTGVTEDGGAPNIVTITDALVVGAPTSTVAIGASDIVAGLAGGYFLHYDPSAAQLFFGEDFGGGQTYLGLYASENGTQIDMVSDAVFGWSSSTTTLAGAQDTRLSRPAAGEVLVDDGAGGAATLTAATVKLGTGGPTLTNTAGTVTASGQLLADSLASGATHSAYSDPGDLFCGPTTDSENSSFRWDSSNLAAYFSNGSGLSAISMSPSNASVNLGSNGGLYFAETTSIASAKDASLTRAAAGVVKIGNGAGGDGQSTHSGVVRTTDWDTTLTDATATGILTVTCATETSAGGVIDVVVHATDGTDMQARTITVRYSVVNKAGTITSSATVSSTEDATVSVGTLTVTADTSNGAGVATIRLTATSSLTTTSLVANCHVRSLGIQSVTPQ